MAVRITGEMARALEAAGVRLGPPAGAPRNKYGARPTAYGGVRYDSKAEAGRAEMLDLMAGTGVIDWWIGQPVFRLGCPENLYRADFLVVARGGRPRRGRQGPRDGQVQEGQETVGQLRPVRTVADQGQGDRGGPPRGARYFPMTDPYRLLAESPDALPVIADLLEELGRDVEAAAFRSGAILHPGDGDGYGYGSGSGSGYGDGYGYGYGDGSGHGHGDGYGDGDGDGSGDGYGYGDGAGHGHGDGYGYGYGYGDGSGHGHGDGYGYGYGYGDGHGHGHGYDKLPLERKSMHEYEPGEVLMFASPGGWMWVGRFVRPIGLFGGVFSDVVNVCRTGGTSWPDLCLGKGRGGARFQPYPAGELRFNVVNAPVVPWQGEIPR